MHFAPLKRMGLIAAWYDGELDAGEDANAVMMKELLKADINICLLSPRFIANDYIWNIKNAESQRA